MQSRALAGSLLALLALTPACAPTRSDALLDAAQKARELDAAGRYAEAEPLLREALERSRWGLGTKDPVTAALLSGLALTYDAQGRSGDAEALYKSVIAIDEEVLGPDDPALATDLDNLAGMYREQGRYAEAEPLLRNALSIQERAHGPRHTAVARSLNALALTLDAEGRYTEAAQRYERVIAIDQTILGPDHPALATDLGNLAGLYRAEGRDAEALPLEARAQAIATAGDERPTPLPTGGEPGRSEETAPAAHDGFAIHLASVRDPADVPGEWARLAKLYPALVALELRPAPMIDIPEKGVFYRVVVGAFPTRADAQAACAPVKAGGAYCALVQP